MKFLATLAIVGFTAATAFAGGAGCKPAGCNPDRECTPCCCKPVAKMVDIKKTCYEIETKTICIPPTVFPWDRSPCADVCGEKCGGKCGTKDACGKCGDAGKCGEAGKCGAGCGSDRCCDNGGLLSGLRDALGMGLCPTSRCVKTLKKSSKKVGERCVCEWVCDGPSNAGCKPACAAPEAAPAAPTPAKPAPAPPETAATPRYRSVSFR